MDYLKDLAKYGSKLMDKAEHYAEKGLDALSDMKDDAFAQKTFELQSKRVTVKRQIAEGGFGFVYEVVDMYEHPYALKRMIAQDRERLASIKNEISLMKQLHGHSNVVRLEDSKMLDYHAGPRGSETEVLMLMEYCSGSLLDHINQRLNTTRQGIKETEIYSIFSQVCSAVEAMHSLNPPVAHRDLKVENVLLSSTRVWKLCDFGSATTNTYHPQNERDRARAEEDINRNTTMLCRAPEMVDLYQKLPINEKVDIWALGCMLYKMAYTVDAFEGGSLGIINGKYRIPENTRYSQDFHDFLAFMLVMDPSERPDIWKVQERLSKLRGTEYNGHKPAGGQQTRSAPRPAAPPHQGGNARAPRAVTPPRAGPRAATPPRATSGGGFSSGGFNPRQQQQQQPSHTSSASSSSSSSKSAFEMIDWNDGPVASSGAPSHSRVDHLKSQPQRPSSAPKTLPSQHATSASELIDWGADSAQSSGAASNTSGKSGDDLLMDFGDFSISGKPNPQQHQQQQQQQQQQQRPGMPNPYNLPYNNQNPHVPYANPAFMQQQHQQQQPQFPAALGGYGKAPANAPSFATPPRVRKSTDLDSLIDFDAPQHPTQQAPSQQRPGMSGIMQPPFGQQYPYNMQQQPFMQQQQQQQQQPPVGFGGKPFGQGMQQQPFMQQQQPPQSSIPIQRAPINLQSRQPMNGKPAANQQQAGASPQHQQPPQNTNLLNSNSFDFDLFMKGSAPKPSSNQNQSLI